MGVVRAATMLKAMLPASTTATVMGIQSGALRQPNNQLDPMAIKHSKSWLTCIDV